MAIVSTKQQRRKAARDLVVRLLTTTMLGVVMFGAYRGYEYLTTSERFAVREVTIRGLCRVDSLDVERLLAGVRGENIFLLPVERCVQRFSAHPRVRSVAFKKVLPNRLLCHVQEREPVAVIYTDKFYEVDEEGMVLTSDKLTDYLDLPVISGLDGKTVKEGTFCRDPRLANALRVIGICKRYGGSFANDISEVRIGPQGISLVSLEERMVLLLGENEFEARLKKFFPIRGTLAKRDVPPKLVDLRFEGQVLLRGGI